MLDTGASRGFVVATLVSAVGNYAPDGPNYDPLDLATISAYNRFTNRVEISDYMADRVEKAPDNWAVATAFSGLGLNVTEVTDTVDAAKIIIDGFASEDRYGNQLSLELGETTILGSASVNANGSVLFVDTPGDPLDGLEIDIPQGAYQEEINFTVSHQPITSYSGNENFDPVTPLISIENSGDYSDEVITMKIPVTIEDGYHYMAFYYDKTTGALEGIPEVDHDSTSLTIATRHFSDIVINRQLYRLFFGHDAIDSGFKVTQDNWPFENPVTYLSPGICSGMSIASLYYYNEIKKQKAYPPLFGFYDNGTSDFDIDDDQAIKLCSTIQGWNINGLAKSEGKEDIWVYFQFIHSILLTGSPQYVSIFNEDDTIGHALVVYKKSGNDLYVADPNSPEKQDEKIEFEWGSDPATTDPKQLTGSFKPIDLKWNNSTNTTFLIGYPEYELKIIDKDASSTERESDLTDNYETTNSVIKIKYVDFYVDTSERITAYSNGSTTGKTNGTQTIEITLNPGDNNIGLLLETNKHFEKYNETLWAWTDFKYFNIKYEKEDTQIESSISVTNTLDINVTVLINGEYPGGNASNGYLEPGESVKQPYAPGTYTILVKSAGVVTNNNQLEYTCQINLRAGQAYVYDFENSQDCNLGKVTISNQTPDSVTLYKNGESWKSISANKQSNLYLVVGATYSLSARTRSGEAGTICFGDGDYQCKYLCWSGPTFDLDCQDVTWTISGSGSACP